MCVVVTKPPLVYGHQKFKTGAIRSFDNTLAYLSDFGGKWAAPGSNRWEANGMFGNNVIFASEVGNYHNTDPWHAHDNNLFANKSVAITGNGKTYDLVEWQKLDPSNHDVGSTFSARTPSGAEIIAMAKKTLGF